MKKVLSGLILASLLVLPAIGLALEQLPGEGQVDIARTLDNIANYLFGLLIKGVWNKRKNGK